MTYKIRTYYPAINWGLALYLLWRLGMITWTFTMLIVAYNSNWPTLPIIALVSVLISMVAYFCNLFWAPYLDTKPIMPISDRQQATETERLENEGKQPNEGPSEELKTKRDAQFNNAARVYAFDSLAGIGYLLWIGIFIGTTAQSTFQPLPAVPTGSQISNFVVIKAFQLLFILYCAVPFWSAFDSVWSFVASHLNGVNARNRETLDRLSKVDETVQTGFVSTGSRRKKVV